MPMVTGDSRLREAAGEVVKLANELESVGEMRAVKRTPRLERRLELIAERAIELQSTIDSARGMYERERGTPEHAIDDRACALSTPVRELLLATKDLSRDQWPEHLGPVVEAINQLAGVYVKNGGR